MKTVTARRRRSPSPPYSPMKQHKRPRRRRVDTVLTFPSSERVQGPPHHSHHYASSDPNNNPTTSHSNSDIGQEDGAVDGSNDEGCAVVDVFPGLIVADPPSSAKEKLVESDWHRLRQRQKHIDYGKTTIGYQRYLELVPRKERKKEVHPQTPDIKQVCSKRSWDGQVKKWRRRLHEFDPPAKENEETLQLFSTGDGSAAHSQEEKDAKTSSDSEGNPNKEIGLSTLYDEWNVFGDAIEP